MGYQSLIEKTVNKDADRDQRFTRWKDFHHVEKMLDVTFTLDACAIDSSAAKCRRYFAPKSTHDCAGVDGLAQSWAGERVWDNCPWSDIGPWCRKHWLEPKSPLSVLYVPNDRAERGWWQQYVEPFLKQSLMYAPEAAARRHGFDLGGLHFSATNLNYRPCFDVPGGGTAGETPMSGVVLLVWDRR